MQHADVDEIDLLVAVLPPRIQTLLKSVDDRSSLVEVVMDLGRPPEARTFRGHSVFNELEVDDSDISHVIGHIGKFGEDNRAGIPRTLHRISAIRNRNGRIIGLTLRIGRAVFGTVDIVREVVDSGASILLLGRPGVGKTTMLRETARILAERKRVVIVDTSNEIGGDGDIPHPGIGRSRRMQVPAPSLQHEVMIEAVENHNPEVIVIDEIGRELEAMAARTIAERGVQLVATAHGNTLSNLLLNPTLIDLVGGVDSVTLSDEEARRRGTQKTVLERKAPPTFTVVMEIQDFQRLAIHHDVAGAVDALLRGRPLEPEVRYKNSAGEVVVEPGTTAPETLTPFDGPRTSSERQRRPTRTAGPGDGTRPPVAPEFAPSRPAPRSTLRVFPYGVSQGRLRQAAKALGVPMLMTEDAGEAQALVTLKSYYRKRPAVIGDAEARRVPVYVLRSNTATQIEHALADMFGLAAPEDATDTALEETQRAIRDIQRGERTMVELPPQSALVRKLQHELARDSQLQSLSRGKEPHRRVRIFRNPSG